MENAPTIARIPCGANIPCGDRQGLLAYAAIMAKKGKVITEADLRMGKRITAARERLGVTVTDLGWAWTGTAGGRSTVQFYEKGETFPPASDLRRLCLLLHIDANELLDVPSMVNATDRELATAKQALLNVATKARDANKENMAPMKAPKKSLRRSVR